MNNLAKYIKTLKLSYSSVAIRSEYTRSYIRQLAIGVKKSPTKEAMGKITEALCSLYDEAVKKKKVKLPRPTVDILFFSDNKPKAAE